MRIRKYLVSILLLSFGMFLSTSTLLAEEPPKVEVFGGYSFVRMNTHAFGSQNLNGWNASVAYNFNNWLGAVADFSGNYKSESFPGGDVSSRNHNFLFGPRFSYRKNARVTPFVHALFGVTRSSYDGKYSEENVNVKFGNSYTGFSMAIGGGIDVKITKNFAIRPAQIDYLPVRLDGDNHNCLRFSTGAVLRF